MTADPITRLKQPSKAATASSVRSARVGWPRSIWPTMSVTTDNRAAPSTALP